MQDSGQDFAQIPGFRPIAWHKVTPEFKIIVNIMFWSLSNNGKRQDMHEIPDLATVGIGSDIVVTAVVVALFWEKENEDEKFSKITQTQLFGLSKLLIGDELLLKYSPDKNQERRAPDQK